MKKEIENLLNENIYTQDFINHFKQYKEFKNLTRGLVINLIDKIIIYENSFIEIYFNFKDEFLSNLKVNLNG